MDTITESITKTSSIIPWPRKLYSNAEEFWRDSQGLHYAYLIYRTLRGDHKRVFQPDAVFYVGKSPAAYLKKVNANEITESDIRQWQRFLWNQAIVPMLIIKSPIKVRVYTAYTQPKERSSTGNIQWLLDTTADVLELDKLWTAIEAGTIYEIKPGLFNRSKAVDRYLLENLKDTATKLAKTLDGGVENKNNLEFVHQFLTRLLFVCYIIERGMINGKHFEDESLKKLKPASDGSPGYFLNHLFNDLKTYSQKKEALCRLFAQVEEHFNGSLFPEAIKEEKERYNSDFISIIGNFLNGHSTKYGQYTLDFWAYDFSAIPIETISAIYENFLGDQGKIEEAQGGEDSQRTTGAYYTPLHLAELTVDIALEGIKKPVHELKVLDPACGSGVFLVSLFGRMAESLRRTEEYIENKHNINWARKVSPLLKQLYGIDTNQTACHITCFSLYLALLEQLEPMDVEYLCKYNKNKKALQPLLAENDEGYNTIYKGNLFDPKLSFKEKDFDIVIGNPPWVSRENQKDEHFLKWLTSKKNTDIYGPEKQIAHGFMWKVSEYLLESGNACLLLPASVLLNDHTNRFQQEWLKSVTVEWVVNFSDLRFILFETAIHPCVAILFKSVRSNPENIIRYESPKTDIRSQKGGSVYIREEDTVCVSIKDIIYTAEKNIAPAFWKSHFWGSWRDRRLLSRLNDLPKLNDLSGEADEGKRWLKGQGCQPYTTTDEQHERKIYLPWWDKKYKFLSIEIFTDLIVTQKDFIEIPLEFQKLRRSPDKKIFLSPKVVVNHDASKVAFCLSPVIFRHTIQAITGTIQDIDLLRFLSVVIKSGVIQYYLFHTSSNWAIERDSVLFYELLSIPFFLPENATDPKTAKDIVAKVADAVESFEKQIEKEKWFGEEQRRKDKANEIRIKLEPLIREYYNVDKYESMLIDDTLKLAVESFHPRENTAKAKIPTLKDVDDKQAKEYAKTLCEMLNNFGEGSDFKVNGEIIKGQPYSVVHVSLAETIQRSVPILTANDKLEQIFKRMGSLLQNKQGRFVFCQNLKVFDGNDLYILKPMQMRFWSRTTALNDADEIAGAILSSRRKKRNGS